VTPQRTPQVGTDLARRQRNHGLDGIRGFAALSVLFAHLVVHMGLLPYAPLGVMGVIMFFALSGYLIAGICWRSRPTWAAYRGFLRRRVVRLAPVVLALCLVGGPVLVAFGHETTRRVARDAAIALAQATAFATAFGVDTVIPFRPTWSLTVEWAFYLVFPVVLLALRRSGADPRRVTRTLAALAVALYAVGLFLPPVQFYLLPVANLGVLFGGAALAMWHVTRGASTARDADPARTWMALLMLAILVVLPGYTLGWAWKAAVLPASAVCTLALIHGCWAGNSASRVLAVAPLRFVGLRAYSLYLWHLPIMWLVWVNMPGSAHLTRALVALAVIVVVVPISFELLERPVLGARIGRRAGSSHPESVYRPQPALEPTNRHGG
jgi:peptidoglycan/LPS O-acetylase OafA/YrhL